MNHRLACVFLGTSLSLIACGSQVTFVGDAASSSASGAGGTTSVSATFSASDGVPYCDGPTPVCFECATSAIVPAVCAPPKWTCPKGTVDNPGQCPACKLPMPLSCDTKLGADVCMYGCALSEECVHQGQVCTTCSDKAIHFVGAYECACDAKGGMSCTKMPGCCSGDDPFECGDIVAMDCVQHRCLQPPNPGMCWNDSYCPGGKCQGAVICPCGANCGGTDKPGTCVKP
jgi:hypothetical protein